MRRCGPTLVLALALAGCGSPAAEVLANDAARTSTRASSGESAYAACRNRAAGNAAALIACADVAIAAAGQPVDTPEAATAFRAALRQLGDDAAQSGGEAARVLFAHQAVHVAQRRAELLSGALPHTTTAAVSPKGDATWARSRAISCRAHPVQQCAARYDALLPMLRPSQAKHATTSSVSPTTGLPLPSCAALKAEGKVGNALVDAFYARYPKALAGSDSVETVPLDAGALDNVVRYVVCIAGATDYDPTVAENGLALFASKRHGAIARHALVALARSSDPAAGAARRFDAQISGYLKSAR
ncbi:hypothetical protein [Sphingomonas trueperi]|uniref:hypothetical protein n=1 Tax=Sphingomonas trueperi TaxID=53317 RepID=UPI000F1DDB47